MSLIEKNARILADLESEWTDLGPLRQINFAVRFNDYSDRDDDALPVDEQVAKFRTFAKGLGCECAVAKDQHGDASICVSKIIAPSAENVTALQQLLESFIKEHDGAYLDGWHYPPKKTVVFWPKGSGSDQWSRQARSEILFEGKLVNDPLRTGTTHQESTFGRVARDPANAVSLFSSFAKKANKLPSDTFNLAPSEFLRRAAARPPQDAEPTVSGFSQWVYSLYSSDFGTVDDRNDGKEAERDIWLRRGEALSCTDRQFLRDSRSTWTLLHNGLHLENRDCAEFFELPQLRVRGHALRASPDLIYSNRGTSEAIIVEIKYTRMPIPKNLWPNVWAQLWCYAQIETVSRAKKLTVVGEVWGEMFSRGYGRGRNRVDGEKLICLRASVRRDPRATAYDRFFRQLFQIYAGQG